jgi:hypothetical protein
MLFAGLVSRCLLRLNRFDAVVRMTAWTFRNVAKRGRPVNVQSAEHAVELLMEHSGWTEYGVILKFVHSERGMITCIANTEFSTLEFNPDFTASRPSRSGSRSGTRVKPVSAEPFVFDDGTCASSIPMRYVLPIIKVGRAVSHIIEHRDFPDGIHWTDPVPEEEPAKPLTAENLFGGIYRIRRG